MGYFMFLDASEFNIDVSGWDVSSVTTMQGMFNTARIFNNDISSWDVSSVTTMQGICKQMLSIWIIFLVGIYHLCEWNLEGKVVGNMFTNSLCTNVECVDCPP